jgi:hypothetical protein
MIYFEGNLNWADAEYGLHDCLGLPNLGGMMKGVGHVMMELAEHLFCHGMNQGFHQMGCQFLLVLHYSLYLLLCLMS